MNTITGEPLYTTRIEETLWGIMLVALTLIVHGLGMIFTLHSSNAFKERFGQPPSFVSGMSSLILASWMIMLVHIVEVLMWSGFFQWKHCFANISTATYFAFLEYTTVGSAFNLPLNWRLLEGMIATAGLLGFAWSTGVLLTLAQEFQDQQMQRLKERREKHRPKLATAATHPPGASGGA
jgi:hypothetical protein